VAAKLRFLARKLPFLILIEPGICAPGLNTEQRGGGCPSAQGAGQDKAPGNGKRLFMGLILLILLILLLVGGLPAWGYSRNWGYAPSGVLGVLLVIVLLLLLFSVIPWGFGPGPVAP
jgi:hypothetical protein